MKRRFKLILVTVILCITTSFAFGQTNFDKSFIGYWTTDGSKTRTVIFKDKNDVLQMVMWDSSDGEEVEIVKFDFTGERLILLKRWCQQIG